MVDSTPQKRSPDNTQPGKTPQLPELALRINRQGVIQKVFQQRLPKGYPTPKVGHSLIQQFPSDLASALEQHLTQTIARQRQHTAELEITIDDQPYWLEVIAIPADSQGTTQTVAWGCHDITERKRVQQQLVLDAKNYASLDRISRALAQVTDVTQTLQTVVEEMLEMFQADRVWLLTPCDPDAPSYRVPVEATVPEFPGAFATDSEIPIEEIAAGLFRQTLEHREPFSYDFTTLPEPYEPAKVFNIKTQLLVTIRPRLGPAWLLGMHQCSHRRLWSDEEKHLLQQIALRVADCLSNYVLLKELEEDIERRKQAEQQTQQLLDQNRALTRRLFQAQEDERRSLSRELHDEFGQLLTTMSLHAQSIHSRCKGKNPELEESAEIITECARNILDGIRSMVRHMRPVLLDECGLVESLKELVAQNQGLYRGLDIQFKSAGDLDNLGEFINITLYRIIQEGITNTVKHAQAQQLKIRLSRPPGDHTLQLSICDDGRGVTEDRNKKEGMGLTGIRERVVAAGGRCQIHNGNGQGLCIEVEIPVC